MKRKLVVWILLAVTAVSFSACQRNGKIDFVDYGFEEFTEPPTQKPTKKPTELSTEKSSEKTTENSTAKSTENTSQNPTEAATKKKKNQEIVINNHPTEIITEKPTSISTRPPTEVPTDPPIVPTQPPTQPPTEPPVLVTADDIKIMYKNYPLTLDADFNAVAGAFGTPDSKTTTHRSVLADEGEEYLYTFDNMKVHTYVREGVERVESVRVEGIGGTSTSKGIVVGNPVSYVKDMYGTPTSQDTVILKYKVDNQLIIFYLDSDRTTVSGFYITREK